MTNSAIPFSRPFEVADAPDGQEAIVAVEATEAERATLARRLGVPAVQQARAEFRIAKEPRGRWRVRGELQARLTRVCVVTLDPFEVEMREPIDVVFASEAEAAAAAARAAHEPPQGESILDQPDPPDPIVDGRIDLGAVAAEFLALTLDPYPHKPGAVFTPPANEGSPEESPFAALSRLKLEEK